MNKINWKVFTTLLAASFVTSAMVLPYALSLSPQLKSVFGPALIIAQMVQALILFSILIYIGLRFSKTTGLGLPFLEKYFTGEDVRNNFKSIISLSVGMGILSALLIVIVSLLFPTLSVEMLKAEIAVPHWQGFLASFYGGTTEEIICRLFLVNFLVWISLKIKKTADGKPLSASVWTAIVLAAVIFGLGHLPITGTLTTITPAVVARAILLNGIPGVIFGWLFYRKGLESAMLAHFSADIGIHVIVPVVASFFI